MLLNTYVRNFKKVYLTVVVIYIFLYIKTKKMAARQKVKRFRNYIYWKLLSQFYLRNNSANNYLGHYDYASDTLYNQMYVIFFKYLFSFLH